eukprot:c12814_g1_i1.p1 GENE.c12814_g1_i1~~c12814_g1_i1.p1  ORF type:complete len:1193 (-),score=277.96 c12814_g1_i1:56-3295(-)
MVEPVPKSQDASDDDDDDNDNDEQNDDDDNEEFEWRCDTVREMIDWLQDAVAHEDFQVRDLAAQQLASINIRDLVHLVTHVDPHNPTSKEECTISICDNLLQGVNDSLDSGGSVSNFLVSTLAHLVENELGQARAKPFAATKGGGGAPTSLSTMVLEVYSKSNHPSTRELIASAVLYCYEPKIVDLPTHKAVLEDLLEYVRTFDMPSRMIAGRAWVRFAGVYVETLLTLTQDENALDDVVTQLTSLAAQTNKPGVRDNAYILLGALSSLSTTPPPKSKRIAETFSEILESSLNGSATAATSATWALLWGAGVSAAATLPFTGYQSHVERIANSLKFCLTHTGQSAWLRFGAVVALAHLSVHSSATANSQNILSNSSILIDTISLLVAECDLSDWDTRSADAKSWSTAGSVDALWQLRHKIRELQTSPETSKLPIVTAVVNRLREVSSSAREQLLHSVLAQRGREHEPSLATLGRPSKDAARWCIVTAIATVLPSILESERSDDILFRLEDVYALTRQGAESVSAAVAGEVLQRMAWCILHSRTTLDQSERVCQLIDRAIRSHQTSAQELSGAVYAAGALLGIFSEPNDGPTVGELPPKLFGILEATIRNATAFALTPTSAQKLARPVFWITSVLTKSAPDATSPDTPNITGAPNTAGAPTVDDALAVEGCPVISKLYASIDGDSPNSKYFAIILRTLAVVDPPPHRVNRLHLPHPSGSGSWAAVIQRALSRNGASAEQLDDDDDDRKVDTDLQAAAVAMAVRIVRQCAEPAVTAIISSLLQPASLETITKPALKTLLESLPDILPRTPLPGPCLSAAVAAGVVRDLRDVCLQVVATVAAAHPTLVGVCVANLQSLKDDPNAAAFVHAIVALPESHREPFFLSAMPTVSSDLAWRSKYTTLLRAAPLLLDAKQQLAAVTNARSWALWTLANQYDAGVVTELVSALLACQESVGERWWVSTLELLNHSTGSGIPALIELLSASAAAIVWRGAPSSRDIAHGTLPVELLTCAPHLISKLSSALQQRALGALVERLRYAVDTKVRDVGTDSTFCVLLRLSHLPQAVSARILLIQYAETSKLRS